MIRPEQELDIPTKENASETAVNRMLEEVQESAPQFRLDIDKESTRIADLFDAGKIDNKNALKAADNGTKALSEDLQLLSGNMDKYNELLVAVQKKIPAREDYYGNPYLVLAGWNENKGTWSDVKVDLKGRDVYSILQPEPQASLAHTIFDLYDRSKYPLYLDWQKAFMDENKIDNASKVKVGQAIHVYPFNKQNA